MCSLFADDTPPPDDTLTVQCATLEAALREIAHALSAKAQDKFYKQHPTAGGDDYRAHVIGAIYDVFERYHLPFFDNH